MCVERVTIPPDAGVFEPQVRSGGDDADALHHAVRDLQMRVKTRLHGVSFPCPKLLRILPQTSSGRQGTKRSIEAAAGTKHMRDCPGYPSQDGKQS